MKRQSVEPRGRSRQGNLFPTWGSTWKGGRVHTSGGDEMSSPPSRNHLMKPTQENCSKDWKSERRERQREQGPPGGGVTTLQLRGRNERQGALSRAIIAGRSKAVRSLLKIDGERGKVPRGKYGGKEFRSSSSLDSADQRT